MAEAVGYLHDTVEDCDVTLDVIEREFGSEVRAGVDAMTKREGEDYHGAYLDRLLGSELGPLAKYADRRHNYGKIHLLDDPATRDRLSAKYTAVFTRLEGTRPELLEWGPVPQLAYTATGWAPNGVVAKECVKPAGQTR